ncbi:MAG TPA: hypothetical protein VNC12_08285 [Solirubrobacteraceae bacterium]|nr:hypothetical protein [Solirubrobacteraceae bacterium]
MAEAGPAPQGGRHPALATSFLRYLDVVLVVASTPFVLLASLPALGFAFGAIGWIVTRFAVDLIKVRAWRARDTRSRAALHLAAILGRVWLIALVVLGAHFIGHNRDGIVAAIVVLVAFTVELAVSLVFRREIVAPSRGDS